VNIHFYLRRHGEVLARCRTPATHKLAEMAGDVLARGYRFVAYETAPGKTLLVCCHVADENDAIATDALAGDVYGEEFDHVLHKLVRNAHARLKALGAFDHGSVA
jgi:hypothetical protein